MIRPTRTLQVVQSSDLSRATKDVFEKAEVSPVRLTRRDGEDFVLVSERHAVEQDRLLELAAQLIAATLDDRGSLADRLSQQLPWINLLSTTDRDLCAEEIIQKARACFSLGEPRQILITVAAWMHTAEAIAAGWTDEDLEAADPIPLERPI